MSEQERETTGSDTPDEVDPDVEAHLLKEALAAGAAAATMFAGTSVASANWQPTPGAGNAVVMPEPGSAGGAVVDPGPGGAGGSVVDPGPGGAGSGVVDPGAGGAGAAVNPAPDAVDRAVAAKQAAKKAAAAKKAKSAAKKPPLEP